MKAITVEPKKPGRPVWKRLPSPMRGWRCARRSHRRRGLRHRCRDRRREIWLGSARAAHASCWATNPLAASSILARAAHSSKGDLVVGIVRRPDPVPCPNCAVGEWDMCRNGQYTERGIKEIDGFMSERWRIEPEYAIKVDPSLGLLGVLLEPTTVVTKALEQVIAVGQRVLLGTSDRARNRCGTDWPAGCFDRQAAGDGGPRP